MHSISIRCNNPECRDCNPREAVPSKAAQIRRRHDSAQTCRVCKKLIMEGQPWVPDVFNLGRFIHAKCVAGGAVPSAEQCEKQGVEMESMAETDK